MITLNGAVDPSASLEDLAGFTARSLFDLYESQGQRDAVERRWRLAPTAKNRPTTIMNHLRHAATNYDDVLASYPSAHRSTVREELKREATALVVETFGELRRALEEMENI